jgi:hypothetical protein
MSLSADGVAARRRFVLENACIHAVALLPNGVLDATYGEEWAAGRPWCLATE